MFLSSVRLMRRRGLAVLGVGGIVAAAVGVLPAHAAVPFADAAFSGSATGTAVHVDALNSGETRDRERRSCIGDRRGQLQGTHHTGCQ